MIIPAETMGRASQHVVKQCQQPEDDGGGGHLVALDCEAATPRRVGSEKISQTCEFNDVRGR